MTGGTSSKFLSIKCNGNNNALVIIYSNYYALTFCFSILFISKLQYCVHVGNVVGKGRKPLFSLFNVYNTLANESRTNENATEKPVSIKDVHNF